VLASTALSISFHQNAEHNRNVKMAVITLFETPQRSDIKEKL
jgi:hypothetical protein